MLLLACLLAASVASSGRRFVGDRYLAYANRLVTARKRAAAIVALERGERWDPGRWQIARRLGDLLKEAYEDLPETVSGKSTEEGRAILRRAISAYLRVIDAEPGDAWAWAGLGELYAFIGAKERARGGIDLGRFAQPGRERLLPPERVALSAVEKAIALEPNGFLYRDQRANLLSSLGFHREALEEYRRSAEIMPLFTQHAWGYLDQVAPDLAREIRVGLETALLTNHFVGLDEILRNLGELASAQRDYPSAEAYLERAIAATHDRSYALVLRYIIGEVQQRERKEDEALSSFAAALAEPLVAAAARARRGEILLRRGQADAAFSELRQAVALKPDDPYMRLSLAAAAEATGRDDLVAESLRIAASMLPHDPEPLRRLVEFYRRKGEFGQAADGAKLLAEGWPEVAAYKRMLEELAPSEP